ncbi:MAG: transposase [Nitrospira sp.]|nr:MAG: transposase [Nitrospira sp.]
MPRTARASVGDYCYHVINRGNARAEVFHADGDYQAFITLLRDASQRIPMRILAYCLMPNHFHLALWPYHDGDLSRWMQWLLTAHVRRYHTYHESSGHIWQGRFKAFPIEQDDHLLTVLRYIELNPVRAHLVTRAEDWRWSSAQRWKESVQGLRGDVGPVARPEPWLDWVNGAMDETEVWRIRQSVNRNAPFGSEAWTVVTAALLGLDASLRSIGRPQKLVET